MQSACIYNLLPFLISIPLSLLSPSILFIFPFSLYCFAKLKKEEWMDEFGGWVDLTVLHIFLGSMRLNLLKGRQSSSKQIILFRQLFSIAKHMIIYISLRVAHSLLWTLKITVLFIFTSTIFTQLFIPNSRQMFVYMRQCFSESAS